MGEAVKSCQEVIHFESDWTGHYKFSSCVMKSGHAGQNFKLVKSNLLIFCFKKRPASLAATKLASKKRTFPPPFLLFLDLCWWLTVLVIPHLSLFTSWKTYSLCIFETVLGVGTLQAFPHLLP